MTALDPTSLLQALGRDLRVRRRSDFERAYNTGARLQGRYMLLFVVPNGGDTSRLGVAASKKLGSAPERNRAKRLARELFRRHRRPAGVDVVVVPRRDILDAPFTRLEADYVALLERRRTPQAQRAPRPPRGRGRPRRASRV